MALIDYANEICEFLSSVPEIKSCSVCGSLSNGNSDKYSDIDIEINVSGIDNGQFLRKVPDIIKQKYPVIFSDFAPSLAPDVYVVSIAISALNPFMIVDIRCVANPHIETFTKEHMASLNDPYEHTLKLLTTNFKHYIRGTECFNDIERMHNRILGKREHIDERSMLSNVYAWLLDNGKDIYIEYLRSLGQHIKSC